MAEIESPPDQALTTRLASLDKAIATLQQSIDKLPEQIRNEFDQRESLQNLDAQLMTHLASIDNQFVERSSLASMMREIQSLKAADKSIIENTSNDSPNILRWAIGAGGFIIACAVMALVAVTMLH